MKISEAREILNSIPEIELKKELARRSFYDYCSLKYPKHYTENRSYLKEICDKLQDFLEQSQKHFFVLNVPPRHYKSFTATNLVEWVFGQFPDYKVMTGSYNESLSTTFARKVRDTIDERKTEGGTLVFNDIFPKTKVKYGQASKSVWALDGSSQDNYLATSPNGTATGFGANLIVIDDIIKNAVEAYNDTVLNAHFDWLTNTMLSRTEGDNWKVVLIMTRWATRDIAGRVIEEYPDEVELLSFPAVNEDGSMLCDDILSHESYALKTKKMNRDIAEANYNQKPIDIKGRLYSDFKTYHELPENIVVDNFTDTADTGADWLCSVNYAEYNGDVYITDVLMSDEPMEVTEPLVAAMLDDGDVNVANFESNNGGRGFSRNVERLLSDRGDKKCVVKSTAQTSNKEARILSSSSWVQHNIFMPLNWKNKYPDFYNQVMSYQRKGRNAHDDAVDVLASIYETVANADFVEYARPR